MTHSGPYARIIALDAAGTRAWAYTVIDPARTHGYRILATGARADWREAVTAGATAAANIRRRRYRVRPQPPDPVSHSRGTPPWEFQRLAGQDGPAT